MNQPSTIAADETYSSRMLRSLTDGELVDLTKIYIGGQWSESAGNERIAVINPATERVIAEVSAGDVADVDRAVAAASAAFPSWSALAAADRADYLSRVSAILAERTEELAAIATIDVGTPTELSKMAQIGLPTFHFGYYAELARSFNFAGERTGNTIVVNEPVGVVGCITPWNFPGYQVALKVASALAAGCTVVVKPSEVAPLGIYALAAIFDEIGLPAGVFNLVSGNGPVIGEAIARHPDVDMVSFTGSTHAGKRIAELASGNVKRVALELGGKSANIILDGADVEAAVANGIAKAYINSGQACSALTRMLVPANRLLEFEAIAKRVAESYVTGNAGPGQTPLGPVVSEIQHARVKQYIQKGIDEGATLITGGVGTDHDHGYFIEPTVFSNVNNQMTIAREEIFGPVLSILPYRDVAEAIEIANDTDYGLAGGVWGADEDAAVEVARHIRAGQIEVNGGAHNPAAPFGGYKQSGLGRECGELGFQEFMETKAINI
jgi:betaine-aldehyde dehydrogenase